MEVVPLSTPYFIRHSIQPDSSQKWEIHDARLSEPSRPLKDSLVGDLYSGDLAYRVIFLLNERESAAGKAKTL